MWMAVTNSHQCTRAPGSATLTRFACVYDTSTHTYTNAYYTMFLIAICTMWASHDRLFYDCYRNDVSCLGETNILHTINTYSRYRCSGSHPSWLWKIHTSPAYMIHKRTRIPIHTRQVFNHHYTLYERHMIVYIASVIGIVSHVLRDETIIFTIQLYLPRVLTWMTVTYGTRCTAY